MSLVNDIIKATRKELSGDSEDKTNIRCSKQLKSIVSHVIGQFCEKILCGIHVYNAEAKRRNGDESSNVGIKIDFEELHGRLNQIVHDRLRGRQQAQPGCQPD